MNAVAQAVIPPQKDLSVTLQMTDDIQSELRLGEGALTIAQAYVIDSTDMLEAAVEEMNLGLKAIKALEDIRKKFIEPAKQILANANDLFNPAIEGRKQAVAFLKQAIATWDEKERARIALENQQREEADRRARQEAQQKEAAINAQATREADEKLRQAEAAAESGDIATAAALEQEAGAVLENAAAAATEVHLQVAAQSTAVAPVTPTKVAGMTMRDNWIAELADGTTEDQAKAMIAAAAAQRPELLALLKIDMSAIGKMAKALKEAMNVPGFKAVNNRVVAGSKK